MLSMRIGFSLFLLAVATFYTVVAFEDLNFMVRNRLGPGFFPRVIGIVTIALLLYSLFVDVRQRAKDVGTKYGRDMVLFTAVAVGYVALALLPAACAYSSYQSAKMLPMGGTQLTAAVSSAADRPSGAGSTWVGDWDSCTGLPGRSRA